MYVLYTFISFLVILFIFNQLDFVFNSYVDKLS